MGQAGSKRGGNGLNSHPCASQMARDHLWENTFWILCCPFFGTKMAHFQAFLDFGWANRGQNDLISLVCAPQMVQHHFWKNAFLTSFRPVFCPKSAHFQCIFAFSVGQNGPAVAQNGLKPLVLASHVV